jgi:hypothetical protein
MFDENKLSPKGKKDLKDLQEEMRQTHSQLQPPTPEEAERQMLASARYRGQKPPDNSEHAWRKKFKI